MVATCHAAQVRVSIQGLHEVRSMLKVSRRWKGEGSGLAGGIHVEALTKTDRRSHAPYFRPTMFTAYLMQSLSFVFCLLFL